MHVNDHKIQDMGVKNVINQYHTKSAISVFILQKSAWLKCDIKLLKQFNKHKFNNNYKMLQNNVIYVWIITYKEPLYQKCSFLSLLNLF